MPIFFNLNALGQGVQRGLGEGGIGMAKGEFVHSRQRFNRGTPTEWSRQAIGDTVAYVCHLLLYIYPFLKENIR